MAGIICKWPESFANGRNHLQMAGINVPKPESSVTPSLLLRTVLPGSEPCLRARFEFPSAKRQQYLTRLDTRLHGALQASTQTSCAMGRIGEAAPRTGSGMIKRRSQVLGVWFL